VLADFDWQRVAALVDAGRFDRLFDTLDEITRRPQGSQAIDTGWLSDADPSTHAELILERLKTYTAVALEGRQPDAHTNLFQLGMDSLMTLDLVRWVRRTTGVTMEPRSLVLFPTLGALSAQLAKLFATRATPADAAATGARVQHAAPRRQEHRVVIEGAEHCVSSWGEPSARPVLCLHGYNDQGPIWQEVARALVGRGRYVIAPDLKGHGLSARSPHARGSDLADFTRDIGAICDALELREITLVGHSLGTLIAVALAAHQPERLAGLCLVEPISPPLEAPRASTSADGAVPVRKHRPFANEAEALQVFEAFHPNMPSALRTELVQRVLVREGERLVWRTDPYAVASSNWTYRKEYLAQLHKIAVQSAIVLGENSEITRDDELVSALPNARVVSVSGGHWIHYEQPERLAEVIDLLGKLGSS